MGDNCRFSGGLAVVAAVALVVSLSAKADDYTLAAGESATFDNGVTNKYGTLYISGDLTVSGNTWLLGTNATAAVLTGGTVTVEGSKTVFGNQANGNSGQKEMFLNPGADGKYTKITVRNGRNSAVSGDYFNVGAKYLTIGADTEEARAQYPDGVFHFLDINGAGVNFHRLVNTSSLTGRVTVAGNSQFGKGNAFWDGFYYQGNFLVEVAEGASLKFNVSNQLGSFNTAGCNVKVTGAGNLEFTSVYYATSGGKYYAESRTGINKGAVLDVTGTIIFDTSSWGGSIGWYLISNSNVFGPNVGKIKSGSNASYSTVFEVDRGAEISVHDFEMKRSKDKVIGHGAIRIDASAASRKFEAVIPASYAIGTTVLENAITIAKSGSYEAEIVATNLPALRVDEGTVRLTADCLVGKLQGVPGAKVIADGCTVTLSSGGHLSNGIEFETANGGRFVKADSGTAYFYGPSVLGTDLHVAGGNVIFSEYGLAQKYWRWTFTKTAVSPNPVWLGRLWLFDVDGGHPGTNLTYVAETQSLSPGQTRFQHDPSTTLELDSTATSWQTFWHFSLVFSDDLTKNMNNFAKLATPVVDPDDPAAYLAVELRLRDQDKLVSGYNLMSQDEAHYPVSWKVEASFDGQTWTEIETRSDVVHAKPGYCNFYDGANYMELQRAGKPVELFQFSGYKSDGLEADATKALSLQVDSGASVDLTAFTVAPQEICALTLDLSVGGGTIHGGSAAAEGTFYILNADGASPALSVGSLLPLAIDGLQNAANLKKWTLVVDGVEKGTWRLLCDSNGTLTIANCGFNVIVR